MRENRTHGSEGGEDLHVLLYPYQKVGPPSSAQHRPHRLTATAPASLARRRVIDEQLVGVGLRL